MNAHLTALTLFRVAGDLSDLDVPCPPVVGGCASGVQDEHEGDL
jgi:hypothetical protein